MTMDLIEAGQVDKSFNQALTKAAVSAFHDYISTHKMPGEAGSLASAVCTTSDGAAEQPSSERRRRRRPSRQSSGSTQPTGSSVNTHDGVTPNDFFFEHQRLRGYHMATEPMRNSLEVLRLQQDLLPLATRKYLQECVGTPRARAVSEGVGDLFHVELWATVQSGQGAYHKDHVHENVLVSGVYYSSVPEGSAPLVFKNDTDWGEAEIVVQPSEGKLVLFPPWQLHGVPPSTLVSETSDSPRVSFAFNVNGTLSDPWDVTRD